ncbi:ABC transporter ATP-binding protein [Dechloromonas agitata]|uniref:ABC transporter ATP-binding protein n=1 Tax=Dechloromonas agitata TaxID=73030 RepID=UPI00237E0223|nr:ABC transporter ATP-binding protein [Dechloromonas agitata]MDE1544051.1 ABC transporter ATP-binding protein [Dechloromonas agitata]
MLKMKDVFASYGHIEALHGINLEIREGEVVCLIGRNGAGKTSTVRAIVQDEIRVKKGTVEFFGKNLVNLPRREVIRSGIGYVPEDRRVFASLTVAENLSVPRSWGTSHVFGMDDVYELFPKLQELRGRVAGVLSGGEQQMLSIARSLLTSPTLLILDEPHEGLAPVITQQVIAAINRLKGKGVSMLISEQHVRLIRECADRVYVIDRGHTVFSGTVAELDANTEIARKYLMVTRDAASSDRGH